MLKITPQVAGDAISFRQQDLVAGHTYKLKMLQKGITSVIPFSTNWATYTNTPAVAGTEGDYTTYTFTCVYGKTRLLFTTEAAGTSGYMADIKLYDTTSGTEVNIDFTTMTFEVKSEVNSVTYSNWLIQRLDLPTYSEDILNSYIAGINFIKRLDFDAKVFKTPEKAIQITAPKYPDGDLTPAAVMTKASVTAGHTYCLEMYKKGILSVQYNEYTNDVWTAHPISGVSSYDGFAVYNFVPTKNYVEIRLSIGGSGQTSFVSGIKLYDLEDETKTNLLNDPTESGNFNNWETHMLNSNQMGHADLAYATTTLINFNIRHFFNIGDVNADSDIDILDLVCIEEYLNYSLNEIDFHSILADCDADDVVDDSDLVFLARFLLGVLIAFP